jgi:DNA-directed DNA polymerase III PolC
MTQVKGPSRFVSLHAHDGFSTFDGLDYPQDHIDFIRENGMDGWCLTNHGHMNSFAHAYLHVEKLNKAGANFKFVPGCEMYVHPDLEAWKLDYDINRAAKKGDQEALSRLRAQREQLVTPITAKVDADDETIDMSTDEGSLTIENEEETKSGKFYDPVKRRHHLVVLPKTSIGLERLFGLVSRGYMEGFYRFPRVDYKMLKEAAKGGHLMISTACLGGPLCYEVFKHLQQTEFDELKSGLLDDPILFEKVLAGMGNAYDGLQGAVGRENVKLELQFNKLEAQHLVNRAIIQFAKNEGLTDQLVVTTDSHYSQPDHWKERELYKKLGWLNYKEYDPSALPQSKEELKCELYPKNAHQLWNTYQEIAENYTFYDDQLMCDAIERTHDIVHEEMGDIHPDRTMKLPSYVVPKDKTAMQALLEACKVGLVKRGFADQPRYIERLRGELGVIKEKNFAEYFLTMKAIMDLAREHMLVGPGRGSGAGSLVNYVLYITDVDPIEYNLLFERFLSKHREECPDIDTDVADRDLLIDLMKDKFGEDNIVPISNYNTFKLKSLVKDISRFYGIEFDEVNQALKSADRDVMNATRTRGDNKSLFTLHFDDTMKYSAPFREFIERHPEIAEPIEVLFKQNKSLGRHAGGVIVAEHIKERMPLILARGEIQTPWVEGMHYKHLEEFGWIKFDLLGLETLRIIQRAIELILQRHEGVEAPTFADVKTWFDQHMDPKVIDLDDQEVYENVYHRGRWAGIFQATQKGAQRLFMNAKPRSIIDIATLTAIYRPGPLSAKVDKLYINQKANPEEVDYKHPLIKRVLEPTYGLIIFQEQVMELCHVVAGFPQEDCDMIRRTIMKRSASKQGVMKKQAEDLKAQFVEGATKNGVAKEVAADLYEKILYFSGYGFNASHAVSYAIDSYYCSWLLTHYEEEWLCAYLESMSGNPDKRKKAFGEVKKLGYKIIPIDINYAAKSWTILKGKKFMPSFLSCKGIGEVAIDEIIKSRPYTSIEDLLWDEKGKWRHSKFNKRAMESLIKIKAFESMDLVGDEKTFSSYKQMHEMIINQNSLIKKWTKKDPERGKNAFYELSLELDGMEEWSKRDFVDHNVSLLGSFNTASLVPEELINKLEQKGVRTIDEIEQKDLYWFIVTDAKPKLTKNKRPYLLLTVAGMSGGTTRMFCWGWNGETEVPLYSVCVAEVDKNDFGCSTKMHRLKVLNS